MSTTPACVERPVSMDCEGERLLGVICEPAAASGRSDLGVVVVVGGPQVRSGSHRQFVQLARALATGGWPVLRFDVRGMGDSTGALRSFEQLTPDIGVAIDALTAQCPGVRRVLLWGLCDGASAALLYLDERRDARVAGLCLVNPWVRSEASLARTHVKHYYRQRVMQPAFWLKLLRGGVGMGALRGLAGNLREARGTSSTGDGPAATPAAALPFQSRMARAWAGFGGPVLLALSGDDYTAREFEEYAAADPAWKGLTSRARVRLAHVGGADHTFSAAPHRLALERMLADWLHAEMRDMEVA